jgi:hypothetical protein
MTRKNPFIYGKVVSGEHYFPRTDICPAVAKYIEARQPVLILGPRRYGKTSFLGELSQRLRQDGFDIISIDLLPITSNADFLSALKSAIAGCRGLPWWGRAVRFIGDKLVNLRPYLKPSAEGELEFSFGNRPAAPEQVKEEILSFLEIVSHVGEKHKLAVFMDEFQQISQIERAGWLERALRTAIQRQQHVGYLYCGSRRSILQEQFRAESRPFYQQAEFFDFPPPPQGFVDWLIGRFAAAGIAIAREAALHLLERVGWSPNFAQLVGHHVVAEGLAEVRGGDIDAQLEKIIDLSTSTFINQYDSLSPAQKRLIKALAHRPGVSPYTKTIRESCDLSQGRVQSALKSLRDRNLIDVQGKGRGIEISFDDPLFQMWLSKKFPQQR